MFTDKFDGSQTNTYSKAVRESYIGFKVAMVGLATAAAGLVAFFSMYL
jgi:hypothetical protein